MLFSPDGLERLPIGYAIGVRVTEDQQEGKIRKGNPARLAMVCGVALCSIRGEGI